MSLEHSMADGGQAPLLPPLMGKGLRASVPGSWLGASAAPEAGGGEHPHSFPPRFHCPLLEGLCSRAGSRPSRHADGQAPTRLSGHWRCCCSCDRPALRALGRLRSMHASG